MTMRGYMAVSFLVFAQVAWASCPGDLFSMDVSDLPGQRTVPGCSSDAPGKSGQCDWHTTVQKDASIGSVRRLVLLSSDHKTGSGSRQHLTVFGCVDDKPSIVLERHYTNGARIEQVDDKNIIVLSGAWARGDPECCPSSEIRQVFTWSPSNNRYIMENSTQVSREQQ